MLNGLFLAFRVIAGLNALDGVPAIAPENGSQTVVEETSRPACSTLNAYLRANLAPGHPCATVHDGGR